MGEKKFDGKFSPMGEQILPAGRLDPDFVPFAGKLELKNTQLIWFLNQKRSFPFPIGPICFEQGTHGHIYKYIMRAHLSWDS